MVKGATGFTDCCGHRTWSSRHSTGTEWTWSGFGFGAVDVLTGCGLVTVLAGAVNADDACTPKRAVSRIRERSVEVPSALASMLDLVWSRPGKAVYRPTRNRDRNTDLINQIEEG
jgi:hypothetical protein